MKLYLEKVYETSNVEQGAVAIIIHKTKPNIIVPPELMIEIDVTPDCLITIK